MKLPFENYTLENVIEFYSLDMKIKRIMLEMNPISVRYDGCFKYTSESRKKLKIIFGDLKKIASCFFCEESSVYKKVALLELSTSLKLLRASTNVDKINDCYKERISDMREEFLNRVKVDCKGYGYLGTSSMEDALSVNEVLHFFHSHINNNRYILQAMPVLSKKYTDLGSEICLRGYENSVFRWLFDMIPDDFQVGDTDMLVVSNQKLIMMVRDRGHALSLEIVLSNNKARIEYYIPTIINYDMVSILPGINRLSNLEFGATGVLDDIFIEDLPNKLCCFISMVPSDSDVKSKFNLA